MFHLLVSCSEWPAIGASLPQGRVFEYTSERATSVMKPGGSLDPSIVRAFPALFVHEIGGPGEQYARVGTIVHAHQVGGEVRIEYTIDNSIPVISNDTLAEWALDLAVEKHELWRTHWAVKEADLFRFLYKLSPTRSASPKVFSIGQSGSVNPNLVTAMMPFKASFTPVYATIQASAARLGLECLRADDIWENDIVIQDVVDLIYKSAVVVCDCTGRNPNVFYEIGIAHTLGRNVVLITQSPDDVPFDLRHIRFLVYLNNGEGLRRLETELAERIRTLVR